MNLANKITVFRLALVPVFLLILNLNIENKEIIAGIIFLVASLTDALDGYIARSKNLITDFGKFIDPLADKILVLSALISLVEMGKVSAWIVSIIVAREFTITGLRILGASSGITISASNLGKFKTIFQLISIILLLFNNFPFNLIGIPMDYITLYLSLFFTIISGVDYLYKNRKIFKRMKI